MSASLTVIETDQNLPAVLGPDLTAAVDLAKAEKAVSTRKAYGTDFRLFKEWCDGKGVSSLPADPETVAAFLASESKTAKPSTLGRRIAAIRYAHKLAHLETPTDSEAVKATLRGIRRTFGGAKVRKAPAVAAKMHSMVAMAPEGPAGLRDRALLLLGFAGAFRRSKLVALDVADIAETETGLLVTIRRSKTDQERRRCHHCHCKGRHSLPCPCAAGMAGCGWYRDRPDLPAHQQGWHGGSGAADRSIRGQHRQGLCRAGRVRRHHLLRPLAAIRLFDVGGSQGRIDFQDDGRFASQVGGYSAGLRPRCRVVQGSRWRRAALRLFPLPLLIA
jgi:hypothetical protein